MRFLFFPFVVLPILELVLLIEVGSLIGAWNTVALAILGAFAGLSILRRQGLSTTLKARQKLAAGELPAAEMIETFIIAIGGFFMLLPGFITDALGIILLIPPFRRWAIGRLVKSGRRQVRQTEIYEGEFYRDAANQNEHAKISNVYEGEFTKGRDKQ